MSYLPDIKYKDIENIFARHFYRISTLIIVEIILIVFYLQITSMLPAQLTTLIRTKIGNTPYYSIWLATITLIVVAFFFYWFFYRRFPKYKADEIGITFVYDYDPEIQKTIDQLLKRIYEEIKLGLDLKIKLATPNNLPKDIKDVHRKRIYSNSKVIVWGNIYKTKNEKGGIVSLKNISFSSETAIVPINPKEAIAIMPNIYMALQGRTLDIHEDHSYADLDVVSNNISEIVLFMLGVSLFLHNKNDEAIKILLKLMRLVKIDGGTFFEQNFYIMCKHCLADAYYGKAREIMASAKKKEWAAEEAKHALPFLNDAIRLNEKWVFYSDLGYIYFIIGEYAKSNKAIKIAKKKAPKSAALPYYSKAFLGMYFEHNIDNALNEYKLAFNKQVDPYQIIEIAEFINKYAEKQPDKLFLNFALGLINKEKIDAFCAIQDFNMFIDKSKKYAGEIAIDKYVKLANDYIAEIKRNIKK